MELETTTLSAPGICFSIKTNVTMLHTKAKAVDNKAAALPVDSFGASTQNKKKGFGK